MASQERTEQRLLSASENCPRSEEKNGTSGFDFASGVRDRAYWLHSLERLATPVLKALAERRLQRDMPLESSGDGRGQFAGLEAFGRLMAGIAPWLALADGSPEEAALRERMKGWYMEAIDAATALFMFDGLAAARSLSRSFFLARRGSLDLAQGMVRRTVPHG